MIKKYNLLEPLNTNNLFSFYLILSELKSLFRQGWLQAKISKDICETVAEHSFSMTMLAIYLLNEFPELDNQKVIKMCLIHDLAEAIIGDITPNDTTNQKDKFSLEKQAISKIFTHFHNGDYWIELWNEFESRQSNESIFVKDIDKLDMLLQSLIYEKISTEDLSVFKQSALNSFNLDKIKKHALDIIKQASQNC
ncbi:MAG: HD domain-containing protein [Candidatus Cloacimonetes bacterium]|jgi:putative hydrolase of HD superfamily|nr:HD domain-containing protein [Candidatus Cloacimonadota bacterium]MDD4156880.1 HD domain-containing protein [Candidatus Cloacimonadota bacterium]